ncbi:MAG: flagellum-specific ATP synthase FliI, partial [Litorimonas sp.]
FLPLCRGQRVGLFAGSGVGKTSLLGGLAKSTGKAAADGGDSADVTVIALIGERGREVRAFVEDVVGPDAMKTTVVFAATSDQPPAAKLRAARLAMATAEAFRDQGQHVLFLFDSLTRFAQAHREVALSVGETPALRAYPPSTFPALAGLCERAGPGPDGSKGDITAVFSVLVQGSDMEEPVADTVRGILDGHIILDRAIAEGGRYPAIDVGRSVSRALPHAATEEENALLSRGRSLLRRFEDGRLMVQSGLYVAGTDPLLDQAVACHPRIDALLRRSGLASIGESFAALGEAVG